MKKIILSLIASLALALPVAAQTFAGGITITGTTNAPLYVGGAIPTNVFYLSLPAKTVTLSGISSTNETVIYSYGIRVVGYTNVLVVASLTNSFATGTNGGTWSTNVDAQSVAVQIVPYAQAAIGAFTNNIYVP